LPDKDWGHDDLESGRRWSLAVTDDDEVSFAWSGRRLAQSPEFSCHLKRRWTTWAVAVGHERIVEAVLTPRKLIGQNCAVGTILLDQAC
jgi:hypothetical protein